MNTSILQSLTRLETSLSGLSDSITSYAPNLSIAQTLLAADAELTSSLDVLATHTSNTILLAHLHSLADNLAATYKRQIVALAEIRREILDVNIQGPEPVARGVGGGRDGDAVMSGTGSAGQGGEDGGKGNVSSQGVDYKTVLAFARNLSQYSAPRGFKPPSVLRAEYEARMQSGNESGQLRNGTVDRRESLAVPAGSDSGDIAMTDVNTSGDDGNAVATGEMEKDKDKNPGLESLDQGIKAWLDPQQQLPFLPWPSDEMIARSGLARVTGWVGAVDVLDEGNAAVTGGAGVGAEEERGEKKEEQEDQQRRENEAQRKEFEQRAREVERPKVYHGLDLYDPDEE